MQKIIINRNKPMKKRPPEQMSEAQIQLEEYRIFKRNRWIFLACTLGICIIVVAVLSIQCKQECDKQIAEYNDPQKFEEAKLLHDALFLKYDLDYSFEAFEYKYSLRLYFEGIPRVLKTTRAAELIADSENLFKLHEDYVSAAQKYNQLARKLGKATIERDRLYIRVVSKLDALKEEIRHCNISDRIKRYNSFYDQNRK